MVFTIDGEHRDRWGLTGCIGDSGGNGEQGNVIEMTDEFAFVPEEFEIGTDEVATWANVGSTEHSATAYEDDIPEDTAYFASGGFDSESAARNAWPNRSIAGNETYEHRFDTDGEYKYFCIPHESAGMTGTLTVR